MATERAIRDTTEASVSLLRQHPAVIHSDKVKRKPYCTIAITVVFLVIALSVASVLCFADILQPLRCDISDKLKLYSTKCLPVDNLSSLSNQTSQRFSNLHKRNVSCEFQNATSQDCNDTINMSEQDRAYHNLAEDTWDIAWEVLHDDRNWHLETGSSLDTGRVYSKTYKNIGRVFKLQGYVECSPDKLFEIVVKNTDDLPSWNPDVKRSETLERLSGSTDIHYMVTYPIAGGLISSRDYINIRHWKSRNNVTMQAGVSTTYPSKPPSNDLVRGTNRPGGVIFRSVKGHEDRCLMEWALSMDVGGWIPQWMVDKAMASTLIDFLKHCRDKVKSSAIS